jgi:hypothetical protein
MALAHRPSVSTEFDWKSAAGDQQHHLDTGRNALRSCAQLVVERTEI